MRTVAQALNDIAGCLESEWVSLNGFIAGDRVSPQSCVSPECFNIHEHYSECDMRVNTSRVGTVISVPEPEDFDEVIVVWDDELKDNQIQVCDWYPDGELKKVN